MKRPGSRLRCFIFVAGANGVVLSEHVAYWDEGGWKDPFSSAALTSRQRNYGGQVHLDGIYTPQMVVDGQAELDGNPGSRFPSR